MHRGVHAIDVVPTHRMRMGNHIYKKGLGCDGL